MVRQVLEPHLSTVPAARHWVWQAYSDCCGSSCCAPGADRLLLELLTTEAVANAVLHGTGEVVLELTCTGQRVRVEVSDTSPVLPRLRREGPEVVGGHGVALIDTLASSWGVRSAAGPGTGKTVWFELPTGAGSPP